MLGVPFSFVTIIPTKKSLGRVARKRSTTTPEERERDITVRLAGAIAETKHTGWWNFDGTLGDYWGLGTTDEESTRLEKRTEVLLSQHWPAVCRVMSALLVHKKLTQRAVLALLTRREQKPGASNGKRLTTKPKPYPQAGDFGGIDGGDWPRRRPAA